MRWWLFICAAILSACSPLGPGGKAVAFDSRPALIFVHGYYGSALRDVTTKRRIFLSAREVLFGRQAYSLYQKELATPPGPELEPDGLFDEVSILPYLYAVDVYGKFLAFARDIPGVQLVPVVYDWRGDIGPAVAKLDETVRALRAAGVTKIAIVGHSLGGLVTAYYLGYGNQPLGHAKLTWAGAKQVDRVFFLGTPFRGSFSIFRNLQRGANFAWNDHLLPTEAVASFPASYFLLPGQATLQSFSPGQTQVRPILDYSFWERYHLGLLANTGVTPAVRQARAAFTREQLRRVAQLHSYLEFRGEPRPATLAVTNVANHSAETIDSGYFDEPTGEFLFDVDDLKSRGLDAKRLFVPGDGTVTAASSTLPAAFLRNAKIIDSRLAHDRLFDEPRLKTDLQRLFSPRKE